MTRPSLPAAALLLALAWPAGAVAQDAHYWTYGYGPVGQLTEGTLVGGVEDLSAVYYNPGALALVDEPRFVIGLTSVELATIDVPGAAGEGLDFDQTLFDIVPSMVAGHVGESRGQADHFAFAFLARHDSDWDLGYTDVRVSAVRARRHRGIRPLPPAPRRVLGGRLVVAPARGPPLDRRLPLLRLPRPAEPAVPHPRGAVRRRGAAPSSSASRTSTTTCASSPRPASPGGRAASSWAPRSPPRG